MRIELKLWLWFFLLNVLLFCCIRFEKGPVFFPRDSLYSHTTKKKHGSHTKVSEWAWFATKCERIWIKTWTIHHWNEINTHSHRRTHAYGHAHTCERPSDRLGRHGREKEKNECHREAASTCSWGKWARTHRNRHVYSRIALCMHV